MKHSFSPTSGRPAQHRLVGVHPSLRFLSATFLGCLLLHQTEAAQGDALAWGKYIHNLPSGGFVTNDLVAPAGLSNLVAISSGLQHAALLTSDGRVQAIGEWTWNQTNVPANAVEVVEIAAGDYHTLARTYSGAVRAWGANYNGQCQVPASVSNSVLIAAGGFHSLSLSSQGTLIGWGDNRAGQCLAPSGVSNVVALAAGTFHSLALKSNGRVVAWGSNVGGQTNVPATLSNVVAIAARDHYCLALRSDGTVVGWGTNVGGQLNIPSGLNGVRRIAAGERHVVALRDTGQVAAWGANNCGQATVPGTAIGCTAVSAGSLHSAAVLGGAPPRFLRTPDSLTLLPGGTGTMAGFALGTQPMTFQWQCSGTNVPGATNPQLIINDAGARHTGPYTLLASNSWGVATAEATVVVNGTPPSITAEPVDTSGVIGTPASLLVGAVGTPALMYQWTHNGADLAGATASELAFPNLSPSQAGDYCVRVLNDYGAITSAVANLAVTATGVPPGFTLLPTNTSVIIASPVRLSTRALGSAPLVWQWYHNGTLLPGATSYDFALAQAAASNAGLYHVSVGNQYGAVTSTVVTLTTVGLPPSVSTQPLGTTTTVGNAVTLQVGAAGTAPLQYQWLRSGTNLPGATATALTLANAQTNQSGPYSVRISNAYGTATSAVAAVLIEQPKPPVIVVQPLTQSHYVGTNVTLSVTATGEAPLAYQWKLNGVAISGATSSSYILNPAETNHTGGYVVTLSNRWGTLNSRIAVLTVTYPPVPPLITGPPQDQTVLLGAVCTLAATASGTAPLSYQWSKNGLPLADSTHIVGSKSNALRIVNFGPADVGNYGLVVTNVAGADSIAPVTANLAPTNGCEATFLGDDTNTLGNWKGRYGSGGFIVIGNLTNLPPGVVVNTGGTTNAVWAETAVVQALSKATCTNINDRIAANWNNLTNMHFDLILDRPYEIAMYCLDWNSLGLAQRVEVKSTPTSPPLCSVTVSNFAMGKYLRYRVAGSVRVNITAVKPISTMVSGIFFDPLGPPGIVTQPQSRTNVLGTPASFDVTPSGLGPFAYQWYHDSASISTGTNAILTLPSVSAADEGAYTVVVGNSSGSVTSAVATLTVLSPPSITAQPQGQTVAVGADVAFSVAANGTAPLTYQWRRNGLPVGGNSDHLNLVNVQAADAGDYTVFVSNAAGSLESASATLTVVAAPTIVSGPADQTVLQGSGVVFSVIAEGTAPLGYQWSKDGSELTGATGNSLSLSGLTTLDSGVYTVAVGNLAGTVSASARLTVALPVTITAEPTNRVVRVGEPTDFLVVASGTGPFNYQWSKAGLELPGATHAVYALAAVQADDSGLYQVVVSSPFNSATSTVAQLDVAFPPTCVTPPGDVTAVVGSAVTLSVVAAGTGPLNYQWLKQDVPLPDATTSELALAAAQEQDAGAYCVLISNVWGTATSAVATVTVVSPPSVVRQPIGGTVVRGQTVELAVELAGTQPLSCAWWKDGVALPGATGVVHAFAGAGLADTGDYWVVAANAYGAVTSQVAHLEVVVPANIISQPFPVGLEVGQTISLTAQIEGTEPVQRVWLHNGAIIPGANADTLTIPDCQLSESGDYALCVSNAWGAACSVTVTVVVSLPPNLPPVAVDDHLLRPGGGAQTIAAAELLVNDTDPDGGTLEIVEVSTHTLRGGTASLAGSSITFTPAHPNHLWDSFTYRIQDDRGGESTATAVLQLDGAGNGSTVAGIALTAGATGPELQLTFNGLPNTVYQIEAAANASGPWGVVATRTADALGTFSFADETPASQPRRFYRTVKQ
jgi:hypothetical protein